MIRLCSFCEKSSENVEKLFSSNGVYICNECVRKCHTSLNVSSVETDENDSNADRFDLKPHQIYERLSEYVIGQNEAKKALSIALYNHHKRIESTQKTDEFDIVEKSNVLMIGPSGSGKTILAEVLAKVMGVPFVIADSTLLTEAGYNGADVDSILSRLIDKASGDIAKAESGIIFLDEIDKIKIKGSSGNLDVGGRGVQQSLLKMIEGATLQVKRNNRQSSSVDDLIEINTRNILFIFSGSFVDMEEICDVGGKLKSIGFITTSENSATKEVNHKSLVKYGLIQEFIGRIPVITRLNPITVDMMIDILTKPKNAITKQYQLLFKKDGHSLSFADDAIRAIAEKSISEETGARGARCTIENILSEAMFNLPSRDHPQLVNVCLSDIGKCEVIVSPV
jgi:ATP-dependent Clp protease ATP-binding subunit ClpX